MKKSILNLGTSLNKTKQKAIKGGNTGTFCYTFRDCGPDEDCCHGECFNSKIAIDLIHC
ncbi:hypothetical protein MK851_07275 [Tenacibaculum sp. 1B UA]|uniref:Bacteriocin-like protein n=1 Tax=Tenacibaculum discolor TaxID=361581 RepID=A0ABT9F3J3_9FLAO|nr:MULTISPECIES: hypothetical protein [Tenacibaculum]MDP2541210.1 hypothetical protein [Tenacibaculum discolor]MDX8553429.1 hypothetical protein [Tenacibaculum sp. 1B UA]